MRRHINIDFINYEILSFVFFFHYYLAFIFYILLLCISNILLLYFLQTWIFDKQKLCYSHFFSSSIKRIIKYFLVWIHFSLYKIAIKSINCIYIGNIYLFKYCLYVFLTVCRAFKQMQMFNACHKRYFLHSTIFL